jgi:hypothetical protein
VTHVLLQEGHLWGRKEVAIPISAMASTSSGIRLAIAKQQVQDPPPVDIDHPDQGTVSARHAWWRRVWAFNTVPAEVAGQS